MRKRNPKTYIFLCLMILLYIIYLILILFIPTTHPLSLDDSRLGHTSDSSTPRIENQEGVGGELPISNYNTYVVTHSEVEMLAKVVYREARGISGKEHQAAVIWCILNRVDEGTWGNTIEEVVTYPNAFAWVPDTPVLDEYIHLATDVVSRWNWEKQGIEDVGRVIPNTYLYFMGDGEYNYYTETWCGSDYWDWSLPNPYQ